jgi:hypothetical protein
VTAMAIALGGLSLALATTGWGIHRALNQK